MKVLSYNALSALGDPSRADEVLGFIEQVNPDVAFISDAYEQTMSPKVIDESVIALEALGYSVTARLNNDPNDRKDRVGFFGLIREGYGQGRGIKTNSRDYYYGRVHNTDITFAGVHMDDRNEAARLDQVAMLPDVDVLMGDLNALHAKTPIARALRTIKPFTELLPEVDPNPIKTRNKLLLAISHGQRLARMADGRTLARLSALGLRDADPSHHPTLAGIVQLDHILISDRMKVENFQVHTDIDLSDHKPISANLSLGKRLRVRA